MFNYLTQQYEQENHGIYKQKPIRIMPVIHYRRGFCSTKTLLQIKDIEKGFTFRIENYD